MKKSFTLIELMIVIAIIGILAAIAIPNFRRARSQARQKSCYANIRVILGAVEMYNMDHSTMMATLKLEDLVTSGYLKSQPKCPESPAAQKYKETADLAAGGTIKCEIHETVSEGD